MSRHGDTLGDKVELNSMETFLENMTLNQNRISKIEFRYMLTAAGMGMTKVILAMKHGMIPPTINVESLWNPVMMGFLLISSSVKPVPGPISENKSTQRSALLVWRHQRSFLFDRLPDETLLKAEKSELPRMAIIGMDGIFGPCNGLDSLYETFLKENLILNLCP